MKRNEAIELFPLIGRRTAPCLKYLQAPGSCHGVLVNEYALIYLLRASRRRPFHWSS